MRGQERPGARVIDSDDGQIRILHLPGKLDGQTLVLNGTTQSVGHWFRENVSLGQRGLPTGHAQDAMS